MPDAAPNAVDMSRWGGELTPSEAACMASQGVHTVIVASGPGGYGLQALQQAAAADTAGMTVEAYVFLEFESDPAWWVREAMRRLEGFPIARWWLDVEDTENGRSWSVADRVAYTKRALEAFAAAGVSAHIYTGGWYWRPYMGNTDVFAREGRLLWNSYYDGDPNRSGLPYGGWTAETVAVEQYQGTTDLCGQSVDLNWVYIPAPRPGKGEVMTPEERELLLLVASLLAGSENGAEFRDVRSAVAALKPLENPGDKRILLGMSALERRIGALEAGVPAPSKAVLAEALRAAAAALESI